tara:strand:+ start:263 stop:574 length:312 start_codon:yes stop_codon:yes gene_type:complete
MLYPFDDVKKELGLNDDRMRYHIRKHKLQYVKMGHKRFFTDEQRNDFYNCVFQIKGADKCSASTKEKMSGTSVVLSPMVTEWLQSGNLQARQLREKLSKSADI